MTAHIYDTDRITDFNDLMGMRGSIEPQALPRREQYGSPEALAMGLEPVESRPDVLLQPDQYVDAVKDAHDKQTLPLYHMYASWRPQGFRYNQDGIGYCWTWSGTGCMMTTRALEDKDTVLLAPVSMGYLVGWANRGNYLGSYIQGARDQGVCPATDKGVNDLTRSVAYWTNVGQREKYRLDQVWDTSPGAMTQHCLSILCYGRSLYIAYNWWGHAVECVGVKYDGSTLQWLISNSHNEDDVIILTGSRAIPSEAYGFISTKLAE